MSPAHTKLICLFYTFGGKLVKNEQDSFHCIYPELKSTRHQDRESLEREGSLDAIVWGLSEGDMWAEIEGSERVGQENRWENLQARGQ